MSSAVRGKGKKIPDLGDSVWNLKTISVLILVLACVTLLMFGAYKLKRSAAGSLPQEFDGVIVDRWAGFNESDEGSNPYFRVAVEIEGNRRLVVPVDRELYGRAKVGMRLRRSSGGFELLPGREKRE